MTTFIAPLPKRSLHSCAVLLASCCLVMAPAAYADAAASSSSAAQQQAQFHVMAGEMAAGRGMVLNAAEEFIAALSVVRDPQLAARATAYALAAKRDDLALQAAQKWLAFDSSASEAREVITRVALSKGNTAEAQQQAQILVDGHPGGEAEGLRSLALMLSQDKTTAQPALALMKTMAANHSGAAAAGQRAVSLLAFRFKDYPAAEKAAREALRLAPNERESMLLLTGALIGRNNLAEANSTMEQLLHSQSGSKDVVALRLGYARLLMDADQPVPAQQQLAAVLKLDPENEDANFATGLLLLDARKEGEAQGYFTRLLKSDNRANDAHYYLGRIAELQKQPAAALAQYEAVEGGNQALESFIRRAQMLAQLNRLPEARSLLSNARQQFPELSNRFVVVEGDLLVQQQQMIAALALYDESLKTSPDTSELLYGRAMLHERMGRLPLAEGDLRSILTKDPDDPHALNALGYMLLEQPSHVAEAAKMVSKAHEILPNDPAILDSWGLALVRTGKLKEGIAVLTQAYNAFPDPEVAAHLGEGYWLAGDKDKAKATWEAGLKDDANHKVLRDTMQRLLGTR